MTVDSLLLFGIVAAAAWGVSRLWDSGLRFVWASGLDPRHRLAHTVAPLRLLLGVATLYIAPPLQIAAAPVVYAALVVVVVLIGWTTFRDILAGLILAMRRPFTIGDQVAGGSWSGRVVSLGLTRVILEGPDGARIDLPARMLTSKEVRTGGGPGHGLPVHVTVTLPASDADQALTVGRLRDHVYLSAYTDPTSPVIVELCGATEATVVATPRHPDDTDELRSDISARAAGLAPRAKTAK